jgi:hypothetical protein
LLLNGETVEAFYRQRHHDVAAALHHVGELVEGPALDLVAAFDSRGRSRRESSAWSRESLDAFNKASAMMEPAELPVHRNSTLNALWTMTAP